MKKDSANVKRTRFRKYFWPAVALALSLLVLLAVILTTYKPGCYVPVHVADENRISTYLTHRLLPTIYNGAQRGEPFEVVITQDGLNDIIARLSQPMQLHSITLSDPQVFLTPQQITLMATARATPLDLVLTIEVNPVINQQGLLNLYINNITLGAVDITTVGTLIGDNAYSSWMSSTGTEPNNIAARICRSLLHDEPFKPTFEIDGKRLYVSQIEIMTKKIIVLLTPVPDQPAQNPAASQTPAEPRPVYPY